MNGIHIFTLEATKGLNVTPEYLAKPEQARRGFYLAFYAIFISDGIRF